MAEDSGRLVALANLVFHPSTWSPTVYCYLEDMFVRRANGTAAPRSTLDLIRAVFAVADRKGSRRARTGIPRSSTARRARFPARVAHPTSLVVYER